MNQFQEAYQIYLGSDHWKSFRKFALRYFGYKCARCPQRAYQIHHKNYNCLNKETIKDVEALCRECHCKAHGRPYDPNEKRFRHPRKLRAGRLKWEFVL